ncbi:MAG: hypothetical protein E1N59_1675 [Puniceicoccaceae bacterium 5H]|nr:MAG: hypothetical protein E1N59_1675 [Puniceicoccaceae bacterium 5H]
MEVPYHTTDIFGVTLVAPEEEEMREVLESLEDADFGEHPYVSLTHESGWTLSYYESGVLLLENLSGDEELEAPRYLRDVEQKQVLEYWKLLAAGKMKDIRALKWQRD